MSNVFFDWSGTIKDAFYCHHWVVDNIFKELGKNGIPGKELRKEWIEPYMLFFNKYFPTMTADEETELYKKYVNSKNYPKSLPINGMVDIVKKIKRDNQLFLITSDINKSVKKEIIDYKLQNVFDKIFTEAYDKYQPIYELICKDSLDLNDTYLIGDSINEIKVARQLNIKSIAVSWGFTDKTRLENERPNYIVDNPIEILKIIK